MQIDFKLIDLKQLKNPLKECITEVEGEDFSIGILQKNLTTKQV